MFDPFPDVIRIEPAGFCNYKCVFCPVGRDGGTRGLLSYGDFLSIFNMIPLPRVLVLYHGGEPLLNKELPRMAKYAKLWGVQRVIVDSNISLLSPSMDLSSIDELRVAFAGNSPEEHEQIRKGANYEHDAAVIKQLSTSPNRPYRIVILSIGDGRIADYLLDEFTGNGCDNGIMFQSLIEKEWPKLGEWIEPSNPVTYCRNLFTTFTILANGDVCLCSDDLMGVSIHGNVFDDTPSVIWKRMQPLRDSFREGVYPELCQSCYVVKGF